MNVTSSQNKLLFVAQNWLNVPKQKRYLITFLVWRWLIRRRRKFF